MGSHILLYCTRPLSFAPRSCRIASGFDAAGGSGIRWQVMKQVDEELRKGNERGALNLVKDLQGKAGGLRFFGAARQVPQRLYTLDELRLNRIEASSLLTPVDTTLGSIQRNIQAGALLGGIAAWNLFGLTPTQILFITLGLLFLWTLDAVSFSGGVSFLVLDTLGHSFSKKYHNRVVQVSKGRVSATTLNKFSCIALAGLATEYLLFGTAEGGLADISTLDKLLKGLGFTQKKADAQVRWAVLNTVLILRRHEKARAMLATAMSEGLSVGSCVDIIEKAIDVAEV